MFAQLNKNSTTKLIAVLNSPSLTRTGTVFVVSLIRMQI